MASRLPSLLIIAASVGLSVGATLLLRRDHEPTQASTLPVDSTRWEALETRLTELERDATQRVPAQQVPARKVPAQRVPATGKPATPETDAQRVAVDRHNQVVTLGKLEQRIERLEQLHAEPGIGARDANANLTPSLPIQLDAKAAIEAAARIILDRNTTTQEKVIAHATLRRVREAYTPAMTRELVNIGLRNTDAEVRAAIWTNFDGASAANLPALVPHLLQALAHDTSSQVRAEAAETLGNFPDDPSVVQALQYAAKHDADGHVRQKAARTLREMRGQDERR